jgi:hypothetical protein
VERLGKNELAAIRIGNSTFSVTPGAAQAGGVSQGAQAFPNLSIEDVDKIRREAQVVTAVSPVVVARAQVIGESGNWRTLINGVDVDYQTIRDWQATTPRGRPRPCIRSRRCGTSRWESANTLVGHALCGALLSQFLADHASERLLERPRFVRDVFAECLVDQGLIVASAGRVHLTTEPLDYILVEANGDSRLAGVGCDHGTALAFGKVELTTHAHLRYSVSPAGLPSRRRSGERWGLAFRALDRAFSGSHSKLTAIVYAQRYVRARATFGARLRSEDLRQMTTCRQNVMLTSMATPKRSTIYFDPEIHRALHMKAAATDRSTSDVVNEAVRQTLSEDAADLEVFEKRRREASVSFDEVVLRLVRS